MTQAAISKINFHFEQSQDTFEQSLENLAGILVDSGHVVCEKLLNGGKVLSCGGNNAVLQTVLLTSTLLGYCRDNSPGLPAVSLHNGQSTSSTPQSNQIFARQIHTLANNQDVLIAFDTLGQSANVAQAIEAAHQYSLPVVLFSGGDSGQAGKLLNETDFDIRVPSSKTAHILETHILLIHCLCSYIDNAIFDQ